MAITRVTQSMMTQRSLGGLQQSLGRLAELQEHLTTGRILNRPSDSPSDTTSAMRLRSSIADQQQYARNAEDGLGWLGQIDNTLTAMNSEVRRARDLGIQGVNGATGPAAREALAVEVDKLRESLLGSANTTYLGRPVFGGVTAGDRAYDPATGNFVGQSGAVNRTIGSGPPVDVQVDGQVAFGPDGDNVFSHLTDLSAALRSGDTTAIGNATNVLNADMDKITSTLADVGTRYNRLDAAAQAAKDAELTLTSSLAEIENTDLPKATMELQMQEVAYQAALASTARVLQPSLLEFLR
jgi:flagellar hook-associated protein 3 FlgL